MHVARLLNYMATTPLMLCMIMSPSCSWKLVQHLRPVTGVSCILLLISK